MKTTNFFDSDLAEERRSASFKNGGVLFSEKETHGIKITDIRITTKEGEGALGKPKGRYLTLSFDTLHLLSESEGMHLCHALEDALFELLPDFRRVLILGLGNRRLSFDCIGVLCAERIGEENVDEGVFCFTPGTRGQTGLESASLARAACRAAKADLLLAIDALAAREKDRLLRAVELSSTGLSPGTGVGNRREPISEETLGVKVISVGIPVVMRATAFLKNGLIAAGIPEREAEAHARTARGLFTVPSELDGDVKSVSELISAALLAAIQRKQKNIKEVK